MWIETHPAYDAVAPNFGFMRKREMIGQGMVLRLERKERSDSVQRLEVYGDEKDVMSRQ